MDFKPAIGSIIEANLLQRLTADKALVQLEGRKVVLQFNQVLPETGDIKVKILEIRNETIFGRMLPQEYSSRDLVKDLLPALTGNDIPRAVEIVKFLQSIGLAITPELVKRMMAVKDSMGDIHLALAAAVKGIPLSSLSELLAQTKGFDLSVLLAQYEKKLMHFSKTSEEYKVLSGFLGSWQFQEGEMLERFVLLFSPDFFRRLTKDSKETFEHSRYLLSRLRKLQLDSSDNPAGTENLIRILDLYTLRSVNVGNYAADFYLVFWKENEENDWKMMEMSIHLLHKGETTELVLVADFPVLGTVMARLEYDESSGLRHLALGAMDESILDHLRRTFSLEGDRVMQNIQATYFRIPEEGSYFSSSPKIKKINLTV